jgi:hypothetical protein
MTVKVAGRWELSWNTPIKEAELWNLPLRDFEVSDWYMCPVSGIIHNEQSVLPLHERASYEEILAENQDMTHVYVEPMNPLRPFTPVWLQDFEHPENALYIFGSVGMDPRVLYQREHDLCVTMPSVQNKGVPWPHQILVAVLYDRLIKSWQ